MTEGNYNNTSEITAFCQNLDVLTIEFENIPILSLQTAEKLIPVRPSGIVLHTAQNRLREKTFFARNGFPTTAFKHVRSYADLEKAAQELGFPFILKTVEFGYDGKGQMKICDHSSLLKCWAEFANEGIAEAFVDFEQEISIIAARTIMGEYAAFPAFENQHVNHILDVSCAPARIAPATLRQASLIASEVLSQLNVVGLLAVEMFVTRDGRILLNELAPRTHNSGHLSIDACLTSQFEQQVRTICGLPLGSPDLIRPAAMANLLGDLWSQGEPNWSACLEDSEVKLHLYGKREPRPGRKMGHLAVAAESPDEAIQKVIAARARLARR